MAQALERYGGNQQKAAQRLSRDALRRRMEKFDLKAPGFLRKELIIR